MEGGREKRGLKYMQKCSKILKDGWIDGLMIGRKFLLLLCALCCRRARAAECIFAPVVNYLIFIRNVAAEPSGGRQQDRLKCSDLHIHVPRGPFDIFFFAFRSSVIQQAQVVVVGVCSYESCKIPNLMHRITAPRHSRKTTHTVTAILGRTGTRNGDSSEGFCT